MPLIESTSFGKVVINGKNYGDVLIIGEKIIPRNKGLLKMLFGTSHAISEDEIRMLLKNEPEVVVIGTGQVGVLKVREEVRKKLEAKAELIVAKTPEAVKIFNQLSGKRVNALLHTTC
ncbi:MAG TPA: hypothetical protein EYP29_04400 [Thermoplasmata archaeon]|nr:hypothetical protein [Thermoplasmata archaeon]